MDELVPITSQMPMRPITPTAPIVSMPEEILRMILQPQDSEKLREMRHQLRGEVLITEYIFPPKKDKEGNVVYEDVQVSDEQGNIKIIKRPAPDTSKNATPISYWKKMGRREMNDKGIEYILGKYGKYMTRNVVFTQLSVEEILMITKTIDRNITKVFAAKYLDFDIDKAHLTDIKDDIVHQCFFAMKQSQNKALMDALTKLVSITETKDSSPKSGFRLSDLSPFGRKT